MATITDSAGAIGVIADGSCVGLGGSVTAGHPMALVRSLIRADIKDLHLVGLTVGLDLDMLVAAGLVRSVSAAYVGGEDIVGLPQALRWAAEAGRVEVHDYEEGIHLASLRARAQRLPYSTWTGALGTTPAEHPLVEQTVDRQTGQPYLKVRPTEIDVALLWAEAADSSGSVLMWGSDFGDEALRNAANLRVVQVERIVDTSVLCRTPDRIAPWSADIVVEAPLSTHPFGGSSLRVDDQWLTTYAEAVSKSRAETDEAQLSDFLDEWIRNVPDEDAYLERVGIRRIRELLT